MAVGDGLTLQQDLHAILPQLTPKQLADAIWGVARQEGKPSDSMMRALTQEVHRKMPEFKWVATQLLAGFCACFLLAAAERDVACNPAGLRSCPTLCGRWPC